MYNGRGDLTLDGYLSEISNLNRVLRVNEGSLISEINFIDDIKLTRKEVENIELSIEALKKRYLKLLDRYKCTS